jgi:hypothetical protein
MLLLGLNPVEEPSLVIPKDWNIESAKLYQVGLGIQDLRSKTRYLAISSMIRTPERLSGERVQGPRTSEAGLLDNP